MKAMCPVVPFDCAGDGYAERVAEWIADPHAFFKAFGPEARTFQKRHPSERLRTMTLVMSAAELAAFRPVCLSLDGRDVRVASWAEVFSTAVSRLAAANPATFAALQDAGELEWLGCVPGGDTSKMGIEQKILKRIVDTYVVSGCISMPSNLFATTGTNVSVVFFDNSRRAEKVVLIDASKLGEKRKEGKNQRTFLSEGEIDQIVETFIEAKAVEGFSVTVTHDEIAAKGYSLSAGQYFDVKIEHIDITPEEFQSRLAGYESELKAINDEAAALDREIAAVLGELKMEN